MFRRLQPEAPPGALRPGSAQVTIFIDGRPVAAQATDTVAAAMLAAGLDRCRTTPVSGALRAPYCMMGVCFDCLVVIDGIGNRQACLVRVREGMRIEMQRGKRELGK